MCQREAHRANRSRLPCVFGRICAVLIMPDWTNRVSRVGSKLDDRFDALKYRLRKRSGSFKNLQVLPYRGFGNSKEIYLKGRVLSERESPKLEKPDEVPRERIWTNILA